MFSLKRLNPYTQEHINLLYQAFLWETENVPAWYENAGQTFGADSWEECLERAYHDEQIDVAVLDESCKFCGLITVVMIGPKLWETFISGPRKSDAEMITQAAFAMAKNMFDSGIAEAFVSWVCSKHRGALRLNQDCGMVEDGVTMFKGSSHGKPLEWKRLILTKERMAELTNGKEQNQVGTGDQEHLLISDAARIA